MFSQKRIENHGFIEISCIMNIINIKGLRKI